MVEDNHRCHAECEGSASEHDDSGALGMVRVAVAGLPVEGVDSKTVHMSGSNGCGVRGAGA